MTFTHQFARVSLTSAQLLSLNSAPIEVITGTSGSIINVYNLYLRFFHGTTPFNPQPEDGFVFYLGNPDNTTLVNYGAISGCNAQGFIDQTQDMGSWLDGWMGGGTAADLTADILGSGLWLTQYNSNNTFPTGSNWTQGNGTMLALIEYAVTTP